MLLQSSAQEIGRTPTDIGATAYASIIVMGATVGISALTQNTSLHP